MKLVVGYLRRIGQPAAILESFMSSYRRCASGIEHELVIIMKGTDGAIPGLRCLHISDEGFDITAYRRLAATVAADAYVFLNSHSRILCDGWLRNLAAALGESPLVGATGSWEQLLAEQSFPNHHVRTNAFAVRADFWNGLVAPPIVERIHANLFEAGPQSMTRQAILAGYEPLVVDRTGARWGRHDWNRAAVFRVGDQEDLMVADNRSDHYQRGDRRVRAWLASLAWGPQARPD